jgi:V-type H+-transporting ATPase subunit G
LGSAIHWIEADESEQHTSGNKKAEEEANKDAEAQIKQIQQAGKKGQDQVVKDLLKAVFDIKPVVPERIEVPK